MPTKFNIRSQTLDFMKVTWERDGYQSNIDEIFFKLLWDLQERKTQGLKINAVGKKQGKKKLSCYLSESNLEWLMLDKLWSFLQK